MKPIVYIAFTSWILVSCQPRSSDNIQDTSKETRNEEVNRTKNKTEPENAIAYIKDSSDYSLRFLKEMEKSGMKNISLVDSFLILGQKDTVIFPSAPEMGKKTVLTARKDKLAMALTIERINQTTIDYLLEMVEFGNTSRTYQGQADLSHQFHLGSEVDENRLTGNAYLSNEFWDSNDTCYARIRLGRDGRYLLGKISKNCNGKIGDIRIDNFPALVEK